MRIWTEEEIDVRMGRLLQWGVVIASVVMAAGATIFLIRTGASAENYRTFHPGNPELEHWRGILSLARRGDGRGVMQLAVLLMVATPVARVLFAVYAFLRIRDWLYMAISVLVLGILIFSIAHAV